MSKRLTMSLVIGGIIIVALTAWLVLVMRPTQTADEPTSEAENSEDATNSSQSPAQTPAENESSESASGITIVFTDNGFEQTTYTVAAGQTVTVKNNSSMSVQFSSDDHPIHTDNPELNMSDLGPGEEASITPQNAGSWGIHDHDHPEFTTTLTVTN